MMEAIDKGIDFWLFNVVCFAHSIVSCFEPGIPLGRCPVCLIGVTFSPMATNHGRCGDAWYRRYSAL